jgi:hypothetical protein
MGSRSFVKSRPAIESETAGFPASLCLELAAEAEAVSAGFSTLLVPVLLIFSLVYIHANRCKRWYISLLAVEEMDLPSVNY